MATVEKETDFNVCCNESCDVTSCGLQVYELEICTTDGEKFKLICYAIVEMSSNKESKQASSSYMFGMKSNTRGTCYWPLKTSPPAAATMRNRNPHISNFR